MIGEHGIPLLSSTSLNWMHLSIMLTSHLSSIGESCLSDFTHTLPLKEVLTPTLNPKWVAGAEATCVSSASSESNNTDPIPREPVIEVPQYYNVPHWGTNSMIESFSPGLDKLSGMKLVPYHLLNQQLISLLASRCITFYAVLLVPTPLLLVETCT